MLEKLNTVWMMSQISAAGYIHTGAKGFLRMFDHHLKKIETPDFQIQFVAVSGFSVLELVLSTHANVNGLLADVATGQVRIQEVYERILHLLQVVAEERELSYDGSIAVYLYCLSKLDTPLTLEAGDRIRKTKGLFWSRQLARYISERFRTQQLSRSLSMSSLYEQRAVIESDADSSAIVFYSTSRISPYATSTENQNLQWDVELVSAERVIA